MRQHPVHALLTPEPGDSPALPGFTRARLSLSRGLPCPLDLPGLGLSVLVAAPTARIRAWLEAPADELAAESGPQRAKYPAAPRADDPRESVAPVLIVARGKAPIAVMPLLVNARTFLPRTARVSGVGLELVLLSFRITAEAMRGPAAGASFVELAWRRLDRGTDGFMVPVARAQLRPRIVATTGRGAGRTRRGVVTALYTEAGSDPVSRFVRGGINWRLTHE